MSDNPARLKPLWTVKVLKVQRWESLAVGYDAGKHVKGRKRFVTVDTLGLVLRVLVTAASVGEREGGKQVLKLRLTDSTAMSRIHTIWVDGGFDGDPFMRWVMDTCRFLVQVVLRPQECKRFVLLPKRWVVERTFGWRWLVSAFEQRLRATTGNGRNLCLPCHDPHYGEAIGIRFHPLTTFQTSSKNRDHKA